MCYCVTRRRSATRATASGREQYSPRSARCRLTCLGTERPAGSLTEAQVLPDTDADWFACLAEPTRVRLLHAVATAPRGMTVGALTEILGISQSTCSHHVRKLTHVGFVQVHKERTATLVTINATCCAGLPHAADAVMGLLAPPAMLP